MSEQKRSQEEIGEELRNQLAALDASCRGYDAGDFWEGPRLATSVYTLVNDGISRSVSILSQLGIRDQIQYLSFATPRDPRNRLGWAPLCGVLVSVTKGVTKAQYMPALDQSPNPVKSLPFADWWNEAVFENRTGQMLSRMDLTFALRSKDGGSHYDESIPISPYLELKEVGVGYFPVDGGIGISFDGIKPANSEKVPNAHLATMRHIAFELRKSLTPYV